MFRIFCYIILAVILIPCVTLAEIKTIFAEYKYTMGDNDSKTDAKRMCLLEAKRRLLEKAGTYIESSSEVTDYQLTKDEISSYAAAILQVDVVKEKWEFVGENMAILMTIKAEVDTSYIEKQLLKIKQDVSAQKKIKGQQEQLRNLERMVFELQQKQQLGKVNEAEARSLRIKRNDTLDKIEKLQSHKIKIIEGIESSTNNAIQYIEIGMTKKEVKQLLGDPRTKEKNYDYWNYGNVWIIIENGLVQCVVYSSCYDVLNDCSDYQVTCLAK